jgi:GNAT superfamily N-acetyltransferase
MNLYFEYIKEREGTEGIQFNDGFITYRIVDDECYIADMFVKKESRQSGIASKMISKIEEIAKEKNCKSISANIWATDKGNRRTLSGALKLGFEVVGAKNDCLILLKTLGGENG